MEYIHRNYHNILLEEQKRLEEKKLKLEKLFLEREEKIRNDLEEIKEPERKALLEKIAEKVIPVLKKTLEKKKEAIEQDLFEFEQDCKAVRDLLLQNPDPIGRRIFLKKCDMSDMIIDMGELVSVFEKEEEEGDEGHLYILGPKYKGENEEFDNDAFVEEYC